MKKIILLIISFMVLVLGGCGGSGSGAEEEYKELEQITVEGALVKKEYNEGETLDITGIKIKAIYDNETTEDITNKVIISPKITDKLTTTNTQVIFTYTYGMITKTVTVPILVYKTSDIKIEIEDPNLEAAIRKELGKSTGSITKAEIEDIMYLEAEGLGIKTLKGLEKIEKIDSWNLDNNLLTNLDGLNNLKSADTLSVSNNKLTNITALRNLKIIDQLWINGNLLTNLDGLENLEEISLWFNASHNQLTNINGLKNLKIILDSPLGEFDLSYNQLTEINALKNITTTKGFIDLSDNKLTNIDGLGNLEYVGMGLNLAYNNITSISPLVKLKKVGQETYSNSNNKMLEISYNQLTNLNGLENLTDCYKLEIDYNQLTNIDALRNYINIYYSMSFCGNKLYPRIETIYSGSMPFYEYTALAKTNQAKVKVYSDRKISISDAGNDYVIETINK